MEAPSRIRAQPARLRADVRAVTIQQPWASLIAQGTKDIENRSWSTRYRGPLLIHAGKGRDASAPPYPELDQPAGAFVAIVNLADVVTDSPSELARPGQFHWVLEAPVRLDRPVPARGSLGLWAPVSDDVVRIAGGSEARPARA